MYENWSAFLLRFAHEIAAKASSYGIFSDLELHRFLSVFDNMAIFDRIGNAHMVHADLWEGNVLVGKDKGSQWNVVALIDVDKAIFGDRDLEFSSPMMRNEDFLKGYVYEFDKSSSAIFRRNTYQLLEQFMYAYIWRAQFENRERYEAAKSSGLAILDKIEPSTL